MKKFWIAGGAIAVVAAIAVSLLSNSDGSRSPNGSGDRALEFEEVLLRDLEEVTTLDGTLGFPAGDPVTSRLQGTITGVAPAGEVVEEGSILFTVDGEPVVFLEGSLPAFREIGSEPTLLGVTARVAGTVTSIAGVDAVLGYDTEALRIDDVPVLVLPGDLPAWRDLDQGDDGPDVHQLETALTELGYDPGGIVVDDLFTSYTALMIDAWQERAGLEIDGRFDLADAFFAPSAPLVVDVLVGVGDTVGVGTPLMVVRTQPAGSRLRLESGDRGTTVRSLQDLLLAAEFDPGEVDGVFGDSTEDAVTAFQVSRGLAGTGVVDIATWEALSDDSSTASVSADVLQLQEALRRLGFSVPVDGIVGQSTTRAIEEWQAVIGAEVDGIVDLGEVIFLPIGVRVTEHLLTIGSPVNDGSPVLATSASSSVVLVDLPADDQDLLEVGQELVVEMPDGSEVAAVVIEISGIAIRNDAGEVVFETTIELVGATVGADLDQAPVDVLVVTDSRSRVMAVPVTALLALVEGGYAVEVEQPDGSLRLTSVQPGLFADGWVEVESDGLGVGDRVVVP